MSTSCMTKRACALMAVLTIVPALPAGAALRPLPEGQAALCRGAVAAAEGARRVPDGFLAAIARVESGRTDPATGLSAAWPWTVNAEGAGSFYATKAEAVDAVRALQARGVHSIDVGCMQVNLMHHPDAFASLDEAFDPQTNAAYAAGFLVSLHGQMGSWPLAAAAYHSQTPTLGSAYQKRVLAEWAIPTDRDTPRAAHVHGAVAQAAAAAPSASLYPALGAGRGNLVQTTRPMAGIPAFGRMGAMMAMTPPAAHGPMAMGRGLAAYRVLPTQLAVRPWARPG